MDRVGGRWDARFDTLAEAFATVVAEQTGTGAALCVNCDGRRVVDIWAGWADAARTRSWTEHSIVMPYSVTKPLAALCLLRLVDAGRVQLDAPVQEYWPQVRAPATIRHVLSHQAGLVAIEPPQPVDAWYDWARICDLLADQEPEWPPGTAHGESALFFGHLVGEVVRRVDGRSLGTYLREEVGVDFYVGVPAAEMGRVVDLTNLKACRRRPIRAWPIRPARAIRRSSTDGDGGRPRSPPSTGTGAPGAWSTSTSVSSTVI